VGRRSTHVSKHQLGRKFEEKWLGRPSKEAVFVRYISLESAIRGVIERDEAPQTKPSSKLFSFVSSYLMSCGIEGKLSFYNATDSYADAQGVDALFRLETKDGEFFVFLDFFHTDDDDVLQILASSHPERFENLGGNIAMMRWVARSLLITHYSHFQDLLYRFKRSIKGKGNIERPEHCFVVTPFDEHRGRGLRALGRAIALSFKVQHGKE
jgi:hypothetical protein